jgi:myo-inositol-1(or 4)-monophosphatase
MERVAAIASRGERGTEVGTGASGDRTLLADREAETAILSELSAVPHLRVLSEEAGEVGDTDANLVAVIDPLDGSSNFSRGIQFYCSSVAIAEGGTLGKVEGGLVRNLVNGDTYFAEKGKGATKNGHRIRTRTTKSLQETIAGIDLSRGGERTLRVVSPVLSKVKRQVHLGANALELCLLAEGAIDAFIDVRDSIRVVDFAAAQLIAREAGATVTSPDGIELDVALNLNERFSYVATGDRELHRQILEALAAGKAP